MMFIDFAAGGKEYKLRLNTRDVVNLEAKLGCNPMAIFGNGSTIPTITTMVQVLHASMSQYNHGITLDKTYEIFDEWLADGHAMTDFIAVIVDVYRVSGIIPADTTEKN